MGGVSNSYPVSLGRAATAELRAAAAGFAVPKRIQGNILAARERALLIWLCGKAPAWVTPDRLTAVGFVGAAVAALGYAASGLTPKCLFLASLGFVINWFGDSLDGSLARHRKIERPRYGFFLDHSVDAINNLFFLFGLGLSPYVSMGSALFLLCGYYLLSIHVFLRAHVDGELPLAYGFIGPTELRLTAIAFNCAIYFIGPLHLTVAGDKVSAYSLFVAFVGAALIAVFVVDLYADARRLKRQDKALRAQRASTRQ